MGSGDIGFLGSGKARRFELPDGQNANVSQEGRGALRYNDATKQFEGSRDGMSYETFGGAGGGGTTVATLAALSALDNAAFADGANVSVASLRDNFVLDTSSTLTVDGITVLATASGTGRWVRRELPSLIWVRQTTWFINALSGSDENDGSTAVTALATHAELVRRFGQLEVRDIILVTVDSDLTEDLYINFNCVSEGGGLVGVVAYLGGTPTILRTGTFTAGTQAWIYTPAASRQDGQVVDTGLGGGSWEIAAGQRLAVTSGVASGDTAWIARNLSPDTARVGPWFDPISFGESTGPSSGDDYEVQQLFIITGSVTVVGRAAVSFNNLCVEATFPSGAFDSESPEGSAQFTNCDMRGFRGILGMSFISLAFGTRMFIDQVLIADGGNFTMGACLVAGTMRIDLMARYVGDASSGNVFQNPGATGAGGGTDVTTPVIDNRGGFFETFGSDSFAFYDYTAAGATIMDVSRNGGVLQLGNFFGRDCTMDTGLRVRSGCLYAYLATADGTPDIATPGVQDTVIGALPTAFGALPASNTTSMCGIVAST